VANDELTLESDVFFISGPLRLELQQSIRHTIHQWNRRYSASTGFVLHSMVFAI